MTEHQLNRANYLKEEIRELEYLKNLIETNPAKIEFKIKVPDTMELQLKHARIREGFINMIKHFVENELKEALIKFKEI